MKILHLNTFDIRGGAARAAYRIHNGLQRSGVNSEMLVSNKCSKNESVKAFSVPLLRRKKKIIKKIISLQKTENPTCHSCNLFSSGIYKVINSSDADIINFHWINNELISISEIKKINKPIVWTLHDMWAFCGAEHYSDLNSFDRYREGYYSYNRPLAHKGIFDIDRLIWKRKQKNWKNLKFSFVAPSKWMADCIRESHLFFDQQATVIPNCLDTLIFHPKNKETCRKIFDIEQKKKILLFGADGGGVNPLKGFHLLQEALKRLFDLNLSDEIQCVVFGGHGQSEQNNIHGISINYIGHIADDERLANLYSAVDIFIIPSIIDNLPNTVMEAMSCGVPCIGFKTGGISDLIDHQENGIIVSPFSSSLLADGIQWLLSDSNRLVEFGKAARDKVLRSYAPNLIAEKYIDLYQKILSSHKRQQIQALRS